MTKNWESVMQGSTNKRKATSQRVVAVNGPQSSRSSSGLRFRFPNEIKYVDGGVQFQSINNHYGGNRLQVMRAAMQQRPSMASTNQVRPNFMRPSMLMQYATRTAQFNHKIVGSSPRAVPQVTQNPRFTRYRSQVHNYRFTRNPQLFQEPARAWNIPSSPYQRWSRFQNHARQRKHYMSRKWTALPSNGTQKTGKDFTFSVVSYNILSDKLLHENKYLYMGCSEHILSWDYRKENLLKELLGFNADILCLQEVDAEHYLDWFQPKLGEAGYSGVYRQRTGTKPDGCAIFYQDAKFTMVKQRLVEYCTKDVAVLDRDNVGIVLLLQPKQTNSETQQPKKKIGDSPLLCVANTHLLFNQKRGDVKLAQVAYLFAEIDRIARLPCSSLDSTHCPIVLCGDFNSLPYSPLHYFITTGKLGYATKSAAVISGQLLESQIGASTQLMSTPLLPWHLGITLDCRWRNPGSASETGESSNTEKEKEKHDSTGVITAPFHFESAYRHFSDKGSPEVTTCHSRSCCNVDYVFFTPGRRQEKVGEGSKPCTKTRGSLTVLGRLDLLHRSDTDLIRQMPNFQFSSDHIALHVLFKLS